MPETEDHVKILLDVKQTLETLIKSKTDLIESLKNEIELLQQQLIRLTSQISTQSFTSADSLLDPEKLSKLKSKPEDDSSAIFKKIFDSKNEILANFQYQKNNIFIRFPKPKESRITHEKYLDRFVKGTLMNIIKTEPKMTVKFTKISDANLDFVDTISLLNISQYESFETVFESVRRLLSETCLT